MSEETRRHRAETNARLDTEILRRECSILHLEGEIDGLRAQRLPELAEDMAWRRGQASPLLRQLEEMADAVFAGRLGGQAFCDTVQMVKAAL